MTQDWLFHTSRVLAAGAVARNGLALYLGALLLMAGCVMPAAPVGAPTVEASAQTTPTEVTPTEVTPTEITPTEITPTEVTPPDGAPTENRTDRRSTAVLCTICGGSFLLLDEGAATPVALPEVRSGVFYDFTPTPDGGGRILYASQFPTEGRGPGHLAVTDLRLYDLESGSSTVLIPETEMVRALWAPDGEHFVYLRATDESYELRWRAAGAGAEGEDQLLATEVTPSFSVSPSGDQVAFARESNYGLPITPGYFVVDVVSGIERRISDLDKGGSGSVEDRPHWAPDESYLLINLRKSEEENGLFRIRIDDGEDADPENPSTVQVRFAALPGNPVWVGAQPFEPLFLDSQRFVGMPLVNTERAVLGGEPMVVQYKLDESHATVVDGALLSEGSLLGWHEPGSSVWVLGAEGPAVVPLP